MPYKDIEDQRKWNRESLMRKRTEYFAGKCCASCGATHRLELDHINPDDKVSHNIWSWSPARRADELAKCQVLCHTCHVAKSMGENVTAPPHGTHARYNNRSWRCRCDLCTEAHRVMNAKYRRVA